MKITTWLSLAVLTLSSLLAGCGGGGSSSASDNRRSATINIFHALVTNGGETGAIDIEINRKAQGEGIRYLSAAQDQVLRWNLSSGDQYTRVTRSGDPTAILLQTALLFDPNVTYSIFLVGEANPVNAIHRSSFIVLPRDTMGLANTDFRLRIVHAVADAGAVDVYLGDPGTEFKLVSNLSYRSNTSYGDIPVSSLPFRITVTPAGTPPNPATDLLSFVYTAADFQKGKTYTDALVHSRSDSASALTFLKVGE
ncbi:MAG: DUF4397 domain-containing protein [bacterium]